MTEYLLVVLKAATVYAEASFAPLGDTRVVWLKSPLVTGVVGQASSNGAKFTLKKK